MIIHVDDLMLFARTQEHIDDMALKTAFSIKKIGELKYCLGIELTRDRKIKSISINQRAYIRCLAERREIRRRPMQGHAHTFKRK